MRTRTNCSRHHILFVGRYGSGCGFFRPCQPPHIQRQLGNPVAAKGVENMTSLIDCPATRHFTEVLTHTTEVCLLSKEIVSVLFCCCLRSMTRPLTTGTGMDSHCRIKIWRTASNLQTSNTLFKGWWVWRKSEQRRWRKHCCRLPRQAK